MMICYHTSPNSNLRFHIIYHMLYMKCQGQAGAHERARALLKSQGPTKGPGPC